MIEHSPTIPIDFFMSLLLDLQQGCSIQLDRFGDSKILKIGFLVGALSKESRDDLASHITNLVWIQHGYEPSVLLVRKKVLKDYGHEGDDNSEFVWATSVKCKESEAETVSNVLSSAFGRPSTKSDFLCPLLRFVPTEIVMLNSKTRAKFVTAHRHIDCQIILLKMKNMKPLHTVITPPPTAKMEGNLTLLHLLSSMVDRQSSHRVFHAVCPHGYEEDAVVLASLRNYSNIIQQCRSHFTAVVQETFPLIQDSDIFEIPRNLQKVIVGSEDCEEHLESLFQFLKDDFPSLPNNEEYTFESDASAQDKVRYSKLLESRPSSGIPN